MFLAGAASLPAQSVAFSEIAQQAGILDTRHNWGVVFTDFDQDGWDDLYLVVMQGYNRLYRNNGDLTFSEVGTAARVAYGGGSRSAVFGDINNDGYPDLYLGNIDKKDRLYLNQGDGSFRDITLDAGIDSPGDPFAVTMADVDNDGLLDIYVANTGAENILYHNNGDLTFTDITAAAGVTDRSLAMGTVFFDYDNDGDQDLYLVHDGHQPNILYQNDGTGVFRDVSREANADYRGLGMGVAVGDIDHDGYFDLYITNLYENTLLYNNGNGTFRNIALSARVDDFGMGWGANFLDYDNDGWEDIYVANDSYFSPYPNVLYRNLGNYFFEKVETGSPVSSGKGAYGSAIGDIDRNGKVDIAIANLGPNDRNELFLNQMAAGDWIAFRLEGVESNRSAIGARVEVFWTGGFQARQVIAGSGFASQNAPALHFGLGAADQIDSAIVYWPGGRKQTVYGLETGSYYQLKEGAQPAKEDRITAVEAPLATAPAVKVYPNPVRDVWSLELDLGEGPPQTFLVTLTDLLGRTPLVLATGKDRALQRFSWQRNDGLLRNLPPGIYLLKVQIGNRFLVEKLVLGAPTR